MRAIEVLLLGLLAGAPRVAPDPLPPPLPRGSVQTLASRQNVTYLVHPGEAILEPFDFLVRPFLETEVEIETDSPLAVLVGRPSLDGFCHIASSEAIESCWPRCGVRFPVAESRCLRLLANGPTVRYHTARRLRPSAPALATCAAAGSAALVAARLAPWPATAALCGAGLAMRLGSVHLRPLFKVGNALWEWLPVAMGLLAASGVFLAGVPHPESNGRILRLALQAGMVFVVWQSLGAGLPATLIAGTIALLAHRYRPIEALGSPAGCERRVKLSEWAQYEEGLARAYTDLQLAQLRRSWRSADPGTVAKLSAAARARLPEFLQSGTVLIPTEGREVFPYERRDVPPD